MVGSNCRADLSELYRLTDTVVRCMLIGQQLGVRERALRSPGHYGDRRQRLG